MGRRLVFAFVFLLFSPGVLLQRAWTQELTFKDHGKKIQTLSLQEMIKIAAPSEITVWDPNAADAIKFKAFPVSKLFDHVYGKKWHSEEEVLFTCTDGYQPVIAAARFQQYKAFFATERLDQKNFSLVDMDEHGKKVSLGPFYLIWDNMSHPEIKEGDGAAWPYSLKEVDLTDVKEQFPLLAPPADSSEAAKRGFIAFQNHCLSCHSLNGQGGTQGPELNYPVNITEYYKVSWLKKWILDPTSIRFRTGMPGIGKSVPHREAVVDDIIAYFKAMVHNKVKPAH